MGTIVRYLPSEQLYEVELRQEGSSPAYCKLPGASLRSVSPALVALLARAGGHGMRTELMGALAVGDRSSHAGGKFRELRLMMRGRRFYHGFLEPPAYHDSKPAAFVFAAFAERNTGPKDHKCIYHVAMDEALMGGDNEPWVVQVVSISSQVRHAHFGPDMRTQDCGHGCRHGDVHGHAHAHVYECAHAPTGTRAGTGECVASPLPFRMRARHRLRPFHPMALCSSFWPLTLALARTPTLPMLWPSLAQGAIFAFSDESDDLYGQRTGKPRRELGLCSFAPTATSSVTIQGVIPRVAPDGTVAHHFRPMTPTDTMAFAFKKGEMGHMISLNGTTSTETASFAVNCDASDVGLPGKGKATIMEGHKRVDGDWRVRFRFPLSCFQAFAIAASALTSPVTAAIHNLPPPPTKPEERRPYPPAAIIAAATSGGGDPPAMHDRAVEAYHADLQTLAAETHAAVSRPSYLSALHTSYYQPYADHEVAEAVNRASLSDAMPAEEFVSALAEVLKKAGLEGGSRHAQMVAWCQEEGVSSLAALYSLLQVRCRVGAGIKVKNEDRDRVRLMVEVGVSTLLSTAGRASQPTLSSRPSSEPDLNC